MSRESAAGMPPTLLCIHGWGLNGSVWQDLAGALAGRARVLAPDLPGHGARAGEGRFGGLEAVADELAAGLDARVCVVGWSLGGLLALSLARRHPDKVSSLVLLAATPRFVRAPDWPHAMDPGVLADFARDLAGDFSSTLTRFLALQFLGAPGRGEALRTLKARCLAMPPAPGALAEGLEILRGTDLRAELAGLTAPVHGLFGDLDTLVPVAVVPDLQRLRPDMSVHVLRGAGHAPLLTHVQEVADRLLEWCDGA